VNNTSSALTSFYTWLSGPALSNSYGPWIKDHELWTIDDGCRVGVDLQWNIWQVTKRQIA